MTNLDHALELIDFGLYVLPWAEIERGGKVVKLPQIPNWQNDATADPGVAHDWFTGKHRHHAVGIAHRLSGTVALDLDRHREGEDGIAAMERVLERGLPWPVTANFQTPKGHQYLFSRPDSGAYNELSGNISKSADLGFDDGVQLIWGFSAAPSGKLTPGRLWARTPWEGDIATLPTWVYAELEAKRLAEKIAQKPVPPRYLPLPGTVDRDRAYCLRTINATADRIAMAPEGTRQNTLRDEAFLCGRAIGRKGLLDLLRDAHDILLLAAPWVDARRERATLSRALEQGYSDGENRP